MTVDVGTATSYRSPPLAAGSSTTFSVRAVDEFGQSVETVPQ